VDELYPIALLDRYHAPQHKGTLALAAWSAQDSNPFCGDSLSIQGMFDDLGRIDAVVYSGYGCVICEAACDLLLEYAQGKSVDEIVALDQAFMEQLIGVEPPHSRLRCLMLALDTLKKALTQVV